MLLMNALPTIFISPASPEKSYPQPYSPFPSTALNIDDDDGFRASRLSVPPSASASPWRPSPLRPANCPPRQGLNRDQFDALLRVSREQRSGLKTQKVPDLRKELALKNQKLKQEERRALFLSKVKELPSSVTDYAPKIHLDSPLIVHPLNGLGSPFRVFESTTGLDSPIDLGSDKGVEDFLPVRVQLPTVAKALPSVLAKKSSRGAPSLDEITARLKPTVTVERSTSQSRLPSFLRALNPSYPPTFPVRTLAVNNEKFDLSPFQGNGRELSHSSKIEPTIPVSPRVVTPTSRSLDRPTQRAGRAIAGQDMIATLKRRNSPPPGLGRASRA